MKVEVKKSEIVLVALSTMGIITSSAYIVVKLMSVI